MVAYVGINFRDAIAKAGFGTAMSKNLNGTFVLSTANTIGAATRCPTRAPRRTKG
jgi:hypothetical protein